MRGDINNNKARKKKKHLLCIGSNIKEQRINRRLAQTELAYILDVSVEDINNIEEGKNSNQLSLELLLDIANLFKVFPEELFKDN
ncbi:MAG: helix-turn-helix transcriptional regulator [Succinivibrio sp.]|nr:helix-turn-helix transcriptional regulator [Succinivibrio sp.]